MASKPYVAPKHDLPAPLANLTYDQYRGIRFNPEHAIWHDSSEYELQLFHPGFLFLEPIAITLIDEYSVFKKLSFDPDQFIYEREATSLASALASVQKEGIGFSGFRVHYPINQSSYKDEMLVFQGASYFRPLGPNQAYGISARGLAINTGEPSGEEFPRFSEFWIIKPKPNDHYLTIAALLDSPSLAGAYIFKVATGVDTEIEVKAKLFTRESVVKLGIAPLTSMFFYGENQNRNYRDFRPEVHDSDGLQVLTGSGEWIWRPLQNPKRLLITSSMTRQLKGFGVAQRDRNFDHYLDLEAKYETRPSLWVEPLNDWGEGRIELVEIPTPDETNDNIVAFWVSNQPVAAGSELNYQYRLQTFDNFIASHALAKVLRTRIGSAAIPGDPNPPPANNRQFVVDFCGAGIEKLSAGQPLEADLQVINGVARDITTTKIPTENCWRASFKLAPQSKDAVDMRLKLLYRDQPVSEVWNYVWTPENGQ
ncbi:glucan biosynthesis protein [Halioxenophilus sp. WMMB6]|uniref:glucan biosynthesis protein n=1 Tax=Halioxenophilus sp. WMMB6 TaxID=3073815 RepID=UPI00398BC424